MGRSKWVKILPWHYTAKKRPSRHTAEREALRHEGVIVLRGGEGAHSGRIDLG